MRRKCSHVGNHGSSDKRNLLNYCSLKTGKSSFNYTRVTTCHGRCASGESGSSARAIARRDVSTEKTHFNSIEARIAWRGVACRFSLRRATDRPKSVCDVNNATRFVDCSLGRGIGCNGTRSDKGLPQRLRSHHVEVGNVLPRRRRRSAHGTP